MTKKLDITILSIIYSMGILDGILARCEANYLRLNCRRLNRLRFLNAYRYLVNSPSFTVHVSNIYNGGIGLMENSTYKITVTLEAFKPCLDGIIKLFNINNFY